MVHPEKSAGKAFELKPSAVLTLLASFHFSFKNSVMSSVHEAIFCETNAARAKLYAPITKPGHFCSVIVSLVPFLVKDRARILWFREMTTTVWRSSCKVAAENLALLDHAWP